MSAFARSFLYAGLDRDGFCRYLSQARQENEARLRTCALVSLGMFLVLALANLAIRMFPAGCTACYGIMALFSLAVYAMARLLPARNPSLTTGLCCLYVAGLYAFSLVDSFMNPELPAIPAVAILLLGPFLFTERPIYLIVMSVITAALLCVVSFHVKSRRLAFIDLWNSTAFGVISIAAELTQERLRFQLFEQTDRIQYLSETDMLTGCKNRNCFENRLYTFRDRCREGVVCVYVDVNGLHNLNDSQGHEAGDRMLKAVGKSLTDAFGPDNAYRVGGDEYVVIRLDASLEETRRTVDGIAAALAGQGYDISAGIARGVRGALDMDALIKQAEAGMYEEKECYYQQEGHDRRRQW